MQSFIELVVFILSLLIVSAMPFKIGVDDLYEAASAAAYSGACITVDDCHITKEEYTPFLVRLHLIRHGETQANVQGIVLGQQDSPLTEKGLMEARLASSSDTINGRGERCQYWRMYCSDLTRAHTTARIVLGLDDRDSDIDDDNDVHLISDPRLREIAKGAREGYLKRYTTDEAMAIRHREVAASNVALVAEEMKIPKLETVESVLSRARDWIDSIVDDATNDYYSNNIERMARDRNCVKMDNVPKIYNVFALSHSAFIRTMIQEMVGQQLPKDFHETSEGSLDIPNLSRTIIDIRPNNSDESNRSNDDASSFIKWTPYLRRLTDISHLHGWKGLEVKSIEMD